MFNAAVPEFVTVIAWAALAAPTTSSGKARLFADRVTAGDPGDMDPPPQALSVRIPQNENASSVAFFISIPPRNAFHQAPNCVLTGHLFLLYH